MNKRQIALLVTVVVLFHAGLLLFFAKSRSLPFKRSIPAPTFTAREARWVDETTGEALVYREFRVSTRLSELEKPAKQPMAEEIAIPLFNPVETMP